MKCELRAPDATEDLSVLCPPMAGVEVFDPRQETSSCFVSRLRIPNLRLQGFNREIVPPQAWWLGQANTATEGPKVMQVCTVPKTVQHALQATASSRASQPQP